MKKELTLKQCFGWALVTLALLGVLFYAVAHEQLNYKINSTDAVTPSFNTGELVAGNVVDQTFSVEDDDLRTVGIYLQTAGRENTGSLTVSILSGKEVLWRTEIDVSSVEDSAYYQMTPLLAGVAGKQLTLRVTSVNGQLGNALYLCCGNSYSAGRGQVEVPVSNSATLNGTLLNGQLCMEIGTGKQLWFGAYYWLFYAVFMLYAAGYGLYVLRCDRKGKLCGALRFLLAMKNYRFLLEQLVNRDFKTKYKRSMLGVLWSFLNPLLTMVVQYIVFSTLFKSDIENYPAYLLSGIICFTYFNEAVNQCMVSITGNATLITKVYLPKYILPISKALSTGINLLLSLIPLLAVVLLTGEGITPAILLLPFGLCCLFAFSLGIGMMLATSMVFFRDTQFLWGIASMLWMYLTPVFYPESIIPEKLMTLYKMNPLYHVIRFVRTILLDGVSPEPKAYLLCAIACIVPLILGLRIFRRNQNKFILYI